MSYAYLSKKEFSELNDKQKSEYVDSLHNIINDMKIQVEKNCSECEQNFITPEDINVNLLFEDYRECSEHCDECGEEERKYMCDLQFQLISHIAEAVGSMREKLNGLIKTVLKKDDAGKKILKIAKDAVKFKKGNDEMYR